jgi:hypothetical protein
MVETLKKRDHLGDLGVGRKTILKWILMKYGVSIRTGLNWLGYGPMVRS